MKRITSDSKIEEVMAQLGVGEGQSLRESEKRKNMLEKFAKFRSRNPNTTLQIKETSTAFVTAEEGDDTDDEFKNITVTSRLFPQQVTDLPQDYHDYLIQKAMTVHEVGHILYSSYPALEKYSEKVREDNENEDVSGGKYVTLFQNFCNAVEDGAIERYLAEDFRVDEELLVMRATIHEDNYMGREMTVGDDVEYHYPFFHAVMAAAINIGVYDNGEMRKLLDETNDQHFFAHRGGEIEKDMFQDKVVPKLKNEIPNIQQVRDAEKRTEKIYELWTWLQDYIDRATSPGYSEFTRDQQGQEGDSYVPGVPENLSQDHGEQSGEPMPVGGSQEGEQESGDDEGEGSGFGEERGQEIDENDAGNEKSDKLEKAEEKAEKGLLEETKQESGDWSDELEEIIDSLGAGSGVKEIAVADDGNVNQDRLNKAENHGKRAGKKFRQRLKRLRRDKIVKGKRRGSFDSGAMIKAERGNPKVFEKTKEGNEKNYKCVIVADRSGSMSGRIDEVELAVGSIAYGLEENGIDVSVLDTHESMTTLSKPFQTSVDSWADKLFAGRCGGGTPLTGTVQFAKQRLDRGIGKFPFMIIITDGAPSNTSAFKEEIKTAPFPVLGLYLNGSRSSVKDQLSLYNKAVSVDRDESVSKKLISLINKIVF